MYRCIFNCTCLISLFEGTKINQRPIRGKGEKYRHRDLCISLIPNFVASTPINVWESDNDISMFMYLLSFFSVKRFRSIKLGKTYIHVLHLLW